MTSRSTSECLLSGLLAVTLRISSYLGIAPVRFTKRRDGYIIRMSPVMCLYSYALISIVAVATICAVISDYQVAAEHSVRMKTYMMRGIWIADVSIIMLSTTVAVFSASTKMKQFINYYGKIQKINEELKLIILPRDSERIRQIFVIVYSIIAFVIVTVDFSRILRGTYFEHKNMIVAALYGFYYLSYIILHLAQMQFVLMAWQAFNTFERIRKGLSNLLLKKQKGDMFSLSTLNKNNDTLTMKNIVPLKSINNFIDTMAFTKRNSSDYAQSAPLQTTSETIRHLAVSYSEMCDVVKQIDGSFGTTLLLLFGSFLLHLVITPYNLIISLRDSGGEGNLTYTYQSLCMELAWCIYHSSNLIVIVEPCQRSIKEVETIKVLVSKLMHSRPIFHDHVFTELNLFYKHLFLNEVYYAPLNVCTLNRALIATIMSSITTYLVVLIQL